MKKKIRITQYGFIHYIAFCSNCTFDAAINTDETSTRQDVRNAVRRHVRITGHSVTIEGGNATKYDLITANPK